ncbi:MAG: MarR family transcriptional regulator [Gemmatimonadaceae bacterium]|nr:MarR family transcriptional regulator [Gemmatimonadaceae bacterium]
MTANTTAAHLVARAESPASAAGAQLDRVAAAWQSVLRAAMAALELTPAQFRLLTAVAWLSPRDPGVRQADIAAVAGTDPVTTSEVLRTLEARGLVKRSPHPTDRRARSIEVTDAGGALADRAIRLADRVESDFFERGMAEFGPLAKALKRGGRGT